MKEALLYKKLKDKKVQCQLCSQRCLIANKRKGHCGVRQNKDGKLFTLTYGKLLTAQIDPMEKKPLYHFMPGSQIFSIASAGCNFTCDFCQNWQSSQITKGPNGQIIGDDVSPSEIVSLAEENNCHAIAYTYTEPTIFFEYAYETAKLAKKKKMKNVFVTNGYQTPETIEMMTKVVDAANIDLKAFSDDYYRQVCGARLQPVLDSIKLMWQKGIWLEVTTLIIPGKNDNPAELQQIAEFLASISPDLVWHVSRFHPDYKMLDAKVTPTETLSKAVELGKKAGLHYIYIGNAPEIKFENTRCPNCQKLLIQRSGFLVENYMKANFCPACGEKIAGVF
ncbi:MAG: AmmeMemoRadiSam system radical SAM enzyme [Candidatus Woesebacteria bacterium]|jgi:pyruvate formate lyase activating enzyme